MRLPAPEQDLYASAVGTMIFQVQEIPLRPPEYDGVLCLFGLDEDKAAVERVLGERFGTITSCDVESAPAVVRFASHDAARAVRRIAEAALAACATDEEAKAALATALGLRCAGADTMYNERSYKGRRGENGRDDDDGRGWCAPRACAAKARMPRAPSSPRPDVILRPCRRPLLTSPRLVYVAGAASRTQ